MQDHVGSEFDGVIANVTSFGCFIRLAELNIDGLVHVSTLTNDYYQFDPARQTLIGENFRRVYRLGDKVKVRVVGVNLDDRKIDLMLVEDPLVFTGKDAKKKQKLLSDIQGKRERSKQRKASADAEKAAAPAGKERKQKGKHRAGASDKIERSRSAKKSDRKKRQGKAKK